MGLELITASKLLHSLNYSDDQKDSRLIAKSDLVIHQTTWNNHTVNSCHVRICNLTQCIHVFMAIAMYCMGKLLNNYEAHGTLVIAIAWIQWITRKLASSSYIYGYVHLQLSILCVPAN